MLVLLGWLDSEREGMATTSGQSSPNPAFTKLETRHHGVLLCAPGEAAGDGSERSADPGWRRATALIVGSKTNMSSMEGPRTLAPRYGHVY